MTEGFSGFGDALILSHSKAEQVSHSDIYGFGVQYSNEAKAACHAS